MKKENISINHKINGLSNSYFFRLNKKNSNLPVTILLASFIALTGCSSGGGGSSSGGGNGEITPTPPTNPNPNPNPTPDPKPDPEPGIIPDPTPDPNVPYPKIKSAVVDHNFNLSRLSDKEKKQVSKNITVLKGVDGVFKEGKMNHGGKVTEALLAKVDKRYKDDVDIINIDIGDRVNQPTFSARAIAAGIGEAVREGARVVNVSMSGSKRNISPFDCYGCKDEISEKNSYENYKEIVTGNNGYGSVLVVSAGNAGDELKESDESSRFENFSDPKNKEIKERTIIAGGSTAQGLEKHKDSRYPGSNKTFQEMFITAPYESYINNKLSRGTSYSAPIIAAHATSLYSKWPHLTSKEVANRLISTANKDSYLYNRNNCGESNNENCGYYYLGQGEVDIEEAFKPKGSLRMPTGDSVDGDSRPYSETRLVSSGVYGDAIQKSGALDDVAVFDDLGRDYKVDLSKRAQYKESYKNKAIKNMKNLQQSAMRNTTNKKMIKQNNFSLNFSEYSNGNIEASFGLDYGKTNFYLTQKDNQFGSIENNNSMANLNLMSSSVNYTSSANIDTLNKFGMSFSLTDSMSIYSEYEKSSGVSLLDSNTLDNDKKGDSLSRYNVGSNMNFGDLALDFNLGYQNQGGNEMMLSGDGVFELNDDTQIYSTSLTSSYNINNNFTAYGMMERMSSNDAKGNFIDVTGVDTMSFGAGLNWKKGNQRASFAITLPPKATNSYATVNVPVGRELDGTVITDTRTIDLTPSGRQKDIEFAYRVDSDQNNQFFQLNVLHVQDPNHSADADPDNSIMATWGRTF